MNVLQTFSSEFVAFNNEICGLNKPFTLRLLLDQSKLSLGRVLEKRRKEIKYSSHGAIQNTLPRAATTGSALFRWQVSTLHDYVQYVVQLEQLVKINPFHCKSLLYKVSVEFISICSELLHLYIVVNYNTNTTSNIIYTEFIRGHSTPYCTCHVKVDNYMPLYFRQYWSYRFEIISIYSLC